MIVESMALLIAGLALKAGANVASNVASNIENRIINAAIDVVNQKQSPALQNLQWNLSRIQNKQDELIAGQRKQIEVYYKDGISFLGFANTATDKNQKKQFLQRAIECFTSASNIEGGEAAAKATLFVGACFYALRLIDHKTDIALENQQYDRAFQLAEKALGLNRKPPRDLIEQLLRLPYLSGKYGTFEVYWKKWEPPRLIAPPQINQSPWSGWEPSEPFAPPQIYPPWWSTTSQTRVCRRCHKNFDAQPGKSFLFCPECISSGRWKSLK